MPSTALLAAALLSAPAAASVAGEGAALPPASDSGGASTAADVPAADVPEGDGTSSEQAATPPVEAEQAAPALELLTDDLAGAASASGPAGASAAPEEAAEAFAADFGTGKLTFRVEGLPGTPFPADADLSGATIEVVYTLGERDIAVITDEDGATVPPPEDGRLECTTDSEGSCGFSVFLADVSGDATLTSTQLTAPVGFLLPDDPVLTLDDAVCQPVDGFVQAECELVHQDPGAWRTLGVVLTAAADGAPLAQGGFDLRTSPDGAVLDGTTTASSGRGLFDGLYLPGSYQVDQTSAPAGFVGVDGVLPFAVPAATSLAQAREPVLLPVQNTAVVTPSPAPEPSPPASAAPQPTPSVSPQVLGDRRTSAGALPRTGSDTPLVALTGGLLLGLGAALVAGGARGRRRGAHA